MREPEKGMMEGRKRYRQNGRNEKREGWAQEESKSKEEEEEEEDL